MTSAELYAMDEAAALWVQRMAMPVQDSATAAAFDRWILEDPHHLDRYARMAQLWQAEGLLSAMREIDPAAPVEQPADAVAWRLWRRAALALPALAAAILLLVALPPMLRPPVRYAAPRDAMREITLADHSHVQLAPGARIAVRQTPWSRDVTLERGQAFFDVAHERLRGFAVDAGEARIRVLGTAFDVDRMDGEQVIRVYRGIVSVGAGAGREWRLPAGTGIAVRGSNARTLDEVAGSQPDWTEGWFDASNTPVRQLIAHLNRTSPVPIRLAAPVLGDLQVTGRFRLDAPEDALNAVAAIHDLRLTRDTQGYILSR